MVANAEQDKELLRRFKRGDDRAFDGLVLLHKDRLYRLAVLWLDDGQLAADVVQEVFMRAYSGLRKFRFRAEPFTWLYRVTRNVSYEYNRRKKVELIVDEPFDDSSAETDLVKTQSARRVRQLVSGLPERQRQVVVLRIFEELSVRDTAACMRCREGTVKALMYKAVQKLKLGIDEGVEL